MGDRLTKEEWAAAEAKEQRELAAEAARRTRAENEARKAHERTDLTDAELMSLAKHHFDTEQWSCSSCWHGHTCDTGRLIREVQRSRAARAHQEAP